MLNFKNIKNKGIGDSALFLERIMAAIVFVAIIVAVISLWEPFLHFWEHRTEHGAFLEFIGTVFSVVIGIEFFKLLCKPCKNTLLEVLMFVVARHMIIEETSTLENLTSIITIGVLFVIDRFLLVNPDFYQESSAQKDSSPHPDSSTEDSL